MATRKGSKGRTGRKGAGANDLRTATNAGLTRHTTGGG